MMGCRAIARRRLYLGIGAIAVLSVAVLWAPSGLAEATAYLLPALLLLPVLVARRYPGERALFALVSRRRQKRDSAWTQTVACRRRPGVAVPRGGRLIAFSLAVRPPPRPAASQLVGAARR
jgi:hypothetical protein